MMCVSGAKNARTWSTAIESNYVPLASSLAYEGVFNEHYFITGAENEKIMSVNCAASITNDPISGKKDTFLTFGLNSKFDGDGFVQHGCRRALDFVVLLDVSGSMSDKLNEDAADRQMKSEASKTKLQLAIESLKVLMSKLTPQDSFGLITFDSDAYVLIPLTSVDQLDKDKTIQTIDGICSGGSTNLSVGLECAYRQFPTFPPCAAGKSRRVFVLTDDNTNTGDTSAGSLVDIVSKAATASKIYTTTVGEPRRDPLACRPRPLTEKFIPSSDSRQRHSPSTLTPPPPPPPIAAAQAWAWISTRTSYRS
jgi:uncharacterized protein YegL